MKIVIFLALVCTLFAATPPIFNYQFHVTFEQEVPYNNTRHINYGQKYYDPIKNRQRVDRDNGLRDEFCGSILPGVATPCHHVVVNDKRWIYFPQRAQCCFCCDAAHGCGILKPDWLADADYKSQDIIDGAKYDKWYKDGKNVDIQETISG